MENTIVTFAMFGLLASPIFLVFFWMYDKHARPRRYQKRYVAALEALQQQPGSITCRQEALQKGREYYLLLERNKVDVDAFTVGGAMLGSGAMGYLAGKAAEAAVEMGAGASVSARVEADIAAALAAVTSPHSKAG